MTPIPCNWVISVFGVKRCGKPAVIEIHQAGYCEQHKDAAIKMFGPGKPIVKKDLFQDQ